MSQGLEAANCLSQFSPNSNHTCDSHIMAQQKAPAFKEKAAQANSNQMDPLCLRGPSTLMRNREN